MNWNVGAKHQGLFRREDHPPAFLALLISPSIEPRESLVKGTENCPGHWAYEEEGWRARKDGSSFWASVVIDPIRNDDGELIGFANITREISDGKEAQEGLPHAMIFGHSISRIAAAVGLCGSQFELARALTGTNESCRSS